MQDSDYNRKIADEVKSINEKYITKKQIQGSLIDDDELFKGGKRKMIKKGMDHMTKLYGKGFWDDFADGFGSVMKFVPSLLGVGKRKGGIITGGIQTGGAWYDDLFDVAKTVLPLLALGKKKRVGGVTTGGISTGGISTGGILNLQARAVGGAGDGLFEKMDGGRRMRIRRKGKGVDMDDVDDEEGGKRILLKHNKPIRKNWYSGNMKKGKGKDTEGGIITGGKKAPSAWIMHVKKYAAAHNLTYKEAMKKAAPSYKK